MKMDLLTPEIKVSILQTSMHHAEDKDGEGTTDGLIKSFQKIYRASVKLILEEVQ